MKLRTTEGLIDLGDGCFVEADVYRVVEAVRAYDDSLDIICLDPHQEHAVSDAPYILVEKCKDGIVRPISEFWCLDEIVMQVVESADTQRHDIIAVINGRNERMKKDRERRYQDKREENKDIVAHIAGMKSRYTVKDSRTGEIVTFYDDRPSERK